MSETQQGAPAALTLEFDAPELYVSDLSYLAADLKSMVSGLGSTGVPDEVRVRWVVRSISMASPLTIELTPTAYRGSRAVDVPSVSELPRIAVAGIRDLLGGVRPGAFSDQALGHLRGLFRRANKREARVRLASEGTSIELTAEVASAVSDILEPSYHAFGTVEGTLDLINMHGERPIFAVYEGLTGRRVDCSFGKNVALAQAAAAITHRVAVEGEISYRSDGNIVRITAEKLTEFPPDYSLPSADDVLGILSA